MSTVAQMTQSKLREMIESVVERKLSELLRDPDEEMLLRKAVRDRLARQSRAVKRGERGERLTDVARRLGLS